ncbi:glycosyltransferase family 4 protein [Sphingobacterium griseoflavum]|uniref:Glycoside hydrolase n=1 Tax=Sphingobacterium griseoflavum TaxID=1474952 RepID=A0ABQ3HX66_9SPHI|nr:glycosyltransferase family 4 protein [Sphingobacterium griseoflavum]GHE33325.1 glycoside hydrolase [Sphingobacterium griseoflavum]
MEILFVSHKHPPATGGMEKQSYELINGMRECAIVHEIVYKGTESYLQFFRRLNDRILKAVHSHPNIVLIHFNDGLIASLSLWHSGYAHIKRVVTVHGLDVVFPLSIYQRFILKRFNRFDHIIAVSQATAQAIVQRGINPHKVSVIVNGIDHSVPADHLPDRWSDLCQQYAIPIDKKILVMVGRPVKRKGFSWFIREVLPHLPCEAMLVMAGPFKHEKTKEEKWLQWLPKSWQHLFMLFTGFPSDQQEIRRLLQENKDAHRLKHVGKLPLEDLQVLLAHAQAFLMPNIKIDGDMEGFGLVCLEASMCGTMVLASDIEGITDAVVHEKNGLHVLHENPQAWQTVIRKLLEEESLHAKHRKAYRLFTLRTFSWKKMVNEYSALFQSITKQAP